MGLASLLVSLGCALFGGPTIDPTTTGPAEVVLSEIKLAPSVEEPAWVELHNRGGEDIDVRGWTLGTNINAQSATLPGMTLPAGAFLVVRFQPGTDDLDASDGSATVHVAADDPPFAPDAGSLVLYRCAPSPECVVDYVAWRLRGDFTPSDAHRQAVAAGRWGKDALVEVGLFAEAGATLGRDAAGSDTNTPADWAGDGGADAIGPTPGRANAGAPPNACAAEPSSPPCALRVVDELDAAAHAGTAVPEDLDDALRAGVKRLYASVRDRVRPDGVDGDRVFQWLVWHARRDGKIGLYEREDLEGLAVRLGIGDGRRELLFRGCRTAQLMSCENGCPGGECCLDEPRPPGAVTCAEMCTAGTPWCARVEAEADADADADAEAERTPEAEASSEAAAKDEGET